MPERTLLRIGAVSAILGAILLVVANILHPRTSDIDDTEAMLQLIADSSIWVTDHLGLAIAFLLVLGGLVAVYRSITAEPGAALARLGFAGALLSSGIAMVVIGIDGFGLKEVAEAWAEAPAEEKATAFRVAEALEQISFGIFSLFIFVFFGVTFLLYGLAVALSDVYPKGLGWAAVVLGIGAAVLGLVQAYQGPSNVVTNILFPIFSITITLWVLVMGVLMWRKASAAA